MKASIISLLAIAASVNAAYKPETGPEPKSETVTYDNPLPHNETAVPYTTSTVSTTKVITISSCAPTVHDCPYTTKPITTETVEIYTTYCPVTEKEKPTPAPEPKPTPPAPEPKPKSTTSTVSTTKVITISECAPPVHNCPYTTKPITTETVEYYTTICPVTEVETEKVKPTPVPEPKPKPTPESTTSIVITTRVVTISACASSVHNCPYTTKPATTETVETYTTICPVTEVETEKLKPTPQPQPTTYESYKSPEYSTVVCVDCPKYTTTPPAAPPATQTTLSPITKSANTTAPVVVYTGAANAHRAGGVMFAVGLAAAML